MAQLRQLGNLLIENRIVSRERWQRAADRGELSAVLDAIAGEPPDWWDGKPPPPPGLTEYQRWVIECRFAADELPQLPHDLALNQFLLLEKLGQGGQGEVYRGRQLNPARFVAIKTLIRDTDVSRRRFEQEARAMMKIQHPAVARFYLYERVRNAVGEPTDEYVIAMELVEGFDLNRLVRRRGPVPWPFAVHWTIELLGGLSAIHRAGFIHRDVKPENIMIVGPLPGTGVVPNRTAAKLLDLGAVKSAAGLHDGKSAAGVFVGTREYAPPEQWTGAAAAASDLYSLGATLFFALVGRPPFQRDRRDPSAYRQAHAEEAIPDLGAFNSEVPHAVNGLFRQMLAKKASDRGTAEELIAGFRDVLHPNAVRPQPQPAPPIPAARTAKAPSPPTPRPSAAKSAPAGSPPYRAADALLQLFERAFIPGHLRPQSGHEPPIPERVAALLRRPTVLVLVLAVLALLVWWAW